MEIYLIDDTVWAVAIISVMYLLKQISDYTYKYLGMWRWGELNPFKLRMPPWWSDLLQNILEFNETFEGYYYTRNSLYLWNSFSFPYGHSENEWVKFMVNPYTAGG